ncbi:MAG: Rne/Rng family ribonuclease [Bifidobacterium mongoliense]|nr:Rne/Rng family ribonuclease [Bifidobacterium mongoliense]
MNTSHSENAAEQHATTFSAGASPDVGRDETPQTTTRHKRGGRRVVRGAGAAGAAVKLHVEDRPSIFEEPRLHQSDVQSDDRSDADATHGSGEADAPASHASRSPRGGRKSNGSTGRTVRGRRRAAGTRDAAESDDATNVADDASTGESETSAESTANAKDEGASSTGRGRRGRSSEGRSSSRRRSTEQDSASDRGDRGSAHAGRPMASLLFQEPVLPVNAPDDDEEPTSSRSRSRSDDDHTDDDERGGESVRGPRRGRTRRGRSTDDRDDRRGRRAEHEDDSSRSSSDDEGFEEPDERPTRVRRRRTVRHDEPEHDRERDEREDRDGDDESSSSGRGSRSRRLNAQERMAAGEVERIEEDLEYDAITYAPIDDEESQDHTTGRRRRRSHSERDEDGDERRESSSRREESQDRETSSRRHRHEDEDSGTLTRRRRRRRSQHGSEDQEEERGSRRSRQQQYIDEITDVEGSTRLEAKKQRRRDNRRERGRQNQLFEQDFLARRENVERLMVVRERGHHTQISVIEDNVLVEHYVSDIQEVATVGNIYLGRVQNVLPSMEAAFVDIGQPRNGVLYAGEVNWDSTRLDGQPRRIELAFRSGDPVLVQVTKDPIGHKGARLTSQVTLAGRFLVLVPSGGMTGVSRKLSDHERSRLKSIVSKISPKNMGVIIRTAAEGASEEALTKDLENLTHQWETIVAKREEYRHGKRPKLLQGEPDVAIRVVRDIFNDDFSKLVVEGGTVYDRIEQYLDTMAPDLRDKLERWDPGEHNGKDVFDKWQIDSQLRKGMERQVYLPSGGSIVIDRTEAMSTVDVNTGRFIGRGKSLEETVTRCNLEAAEEIARQLRLRDIGGMVMIDFVDMVMPANRDLVLRRLVECLARDRTKHQVAEVTSLGLVQMTRKRIGQGLVEAFSEECPTCKGRGFLVHDEPTISSDYDDPYAMRGGDPFVKTNKHGHGTVEVSAPKGSSTEVKAKLAQIAAAAVSSTDTDE